MTTQERRKIPKLGEATGPNLGTGKSEAKSTLRWSERTLGAIFRLGSGDTKPLDSVPLPSPEHPIPIYGGNGITGYTSVSNASGKNIIIGRVGEYCGSVHYCDREIWITDNALFVRDWFLASDEEFFFYLLDWLDLRRLRNKGGQPLISQGPVYSLRVRTPGIAEQKAIALVLSLWNRATEQTAALIAAKERLKQGLMQQLLSGNRRLRGFHEPWHSFRLGDLFTERRECGVSGLPTLSVTLDFGVVRREDLDKPVRTSLTHEQHLLARKGDIGYNMMRMWQGGSGMAMEDGLVSPAYVVCTPCKKVDSRFAHHLFRSPRMIYLFWAFSYGLTDDRRRLYYDEFARIPVSIPSLEEQTRIAAVIDALDAELFLLAQRRESIQKQKRGLMQQLLTGKVRVPKSLLRKGAKS